MNVIEMKGKFMKKIIYLFLPCFLSLFVSFPVHATSAPVLDNSTYQLVEGGLQQLLNVYGGRYGFWGVLPDSLWDSVDSFLGLDPSLVPEDYHIAPLSEIEKENLQDGFINHFYDSSGNEISIDELYYVTADNGYFHTEFYISQDGSILFSDPESSHRLLNFELVGGNLGVSALEWDDVISHLSDEIRENNFNFSPDGSDLTDNSYFVWSGNTRGGRPSSSSYIIIPNQYNPSVIVPVNSTSGSYINSWYCNDLDSFTYKNVYGSNDWLSVNPGSYEKDGVSYSYLVTFAGGMNYSNLSPSGTMQEWIDTNGQSGVGLFGKTGTLYSPGLNKRSLRFLNVDGSEMPVINPDEMYSYDELQLVNPETDPAENPEYNPFADPSSENWPIVYPGPGGQIYPSDLPLPGSNPNINPVPGLENPLVNLTPQTPIPTEIPILGNLQYRFPFSIPFDLYRMARAFNAPREVPVFNFTFTIPGINYTAVIPFDLSDWTELFALFRTLELIIFIGGLAIFSYEHFFGK